MDFAQTVDGALETADAATLSPGRSAQRRSTVSKAWIQAGSMISCSIG